MTIAARLLNRLLRPAGRRAIEAAGGGRRWQTAPAIHAPQVETLAARGTIAQRARAAVVNQPLAARTVEA